MSDVLYHSSLDRQLCSAAEALKQILSLSAETMQAPLKGSSRERLMRLKKLSDIPASREARIILESKAVKGNDKETARSADT